MPELEKVISALDCRNNYDNDYSCTECPYFANELGNHHAYCDYHRLLRDAIELLKEQEAVKPRVSSVEQRCGNCNKIIEMDGWIACPWCGKKVDWDDVKRTV